MPENAEGGFVPRGRAGHRVVRDIEILRARLGCDAILGGRHLVANDREVVRVVELELAGDAQALDDDERATVEANVTADPNVGARRCADHDRHRGGAVLGEREPGVTAGRELEDLPGLRGGRICGKAPRRRRDHRRARHRCGDRARRGGQRTDFAPAVGIEERKLDLVRGAGLEIENAPREPIRPREADQCPGRNTPQW